MGAEATARGEEGVAVTWRGLTLSEDKCSGLVKIQIRGGHGLFLGISC